LIFDSFEIFQFYSFIQIAEEGIAAFCRLQKPPRIYLEKTVSEILQRPVNTDECHPGDRDDNLWVTINDYKPPKSQNEWEQTCFLDKSFHGYYKWPKIIKYPMNKRERYTQGNMPKNVAILYERFIDKDFISKFTQFMVLDEEKGKINFDARRFNMFKVKIEILFDYKKVNNVFSRDFFVILVQHLLIILSKDYMY
jgi:hypothetical protein